MKHDNNFDLLRLLAAIGVVALHVVDLTGEPALAWLGRIDTKIALSTFFIISGYLIVQSWERSPSLRDYVDKRCRRILPAYVAVVVGMVLVGAGLTTLPLREYVGAATLKYLLANLAFLNFIQPTLPGVFEGHVLPSVNGALWTIKVEVMFYAFVPLLVWFIRRLGPWPVLIAGYIGACLWWGGFSYLAERTGRGAWFELAKQMPGQLMYFLPGAALYYAREQVARHGAAIGAVSAWGLFASVALGWTYLYPLALAGCVVFVALTLPRLAHATRFGDLSYGIYVWHFPLIQTLIALGAFKADPYLGLALLVVLLPLIALASWHLVEKRFLLHKRGPVAAVAAAAPSY